MIILIGILIRKSNLCGATTSYRVMLFVAVPPDLESKKVHERLVNKIIIKFACKVTGIDPDSRHLVQWHMMAVDITRAHKAVPFQILQGIWQVMVECYDFLGQIISALVYNCLR